MKMYLCGVIASAIVLGFCSSCQKELEGVLAEDNDADSTVIRKYIEFDTTLAIGLDTLSITTFDYDNSGRLIRMNESDKDQTAPPSTVLPYFKNTIYFYNSNDSLPFKVISASKDPFGEIYDTAFLFYTSGWVIKDSIRTRHVDATGSVFGSIAVNHFTRNGNNTVTLLSYTAQTLSPSIWPPACPRTENYQLTFSNGNIISEIGNSTSCSGIGRTEGNYTYDNKPSPFYPLRIPYPVMDGFVAHSYAQKNNILEVWFSTPGDGFLNAYTYRNDGYPIVVRSHEVADPSSAWKTLIFYK